ncbi:MAG TPA: PAS domain S-box protein [Phenylobacterium sp.]|nr:PAS domain S-box protein [Phenylobacterium sp.]
MAEELAGLGYWRMDVATQTFSWSPNMFRIYGFKPGAAPPLDAVMDRIHPDDRSSSNLRLDALLSGTTADSVIRIVRPDGTVRHVEGRNACERDADGAVIAIYGVIMDVTERREAERALAAQEAHLSLLAENGADLIVELEASGVIRWTSPSSRHFGYEPQDLVGRKATDLVHPDDREKIAAIMRETLLTGAVDPESDRSYRLLCADGRSVWVEGNPAIFFDDAGRPTGAITLLRDISERRASAQALAEREAHLRLISDHTRDVVFQYSLDRRVLYVSPAARRYGYEPADLVGLPAQDLIHPDDRAKVAAVVADLIANPVPDPQLDRTHRVRIGSGDYVWMESQPTVVRDDEGRPQSVVSLLRDITERRVAAQALAESEQRYRLLTDNATDVIGCYDERAVFTFLSPAIKDLMGYAPEELVGARTTRFMHPDDVPDVMRAFAAHFAAGPGAEALRFEYRAYRKDGTLVWLEAHPKAIYDADGQFVEFQDTVRDITDRKRLEEDLRRARDAAEAAAAVKSEFMANMSHEIRTPLTAVVGFSSLISARADLDPIARGHADRISAAGRALLALVNDVLDFSKLEAGQTVIQPRNIAIAVVAREALDLFTLQAESKGVDLQLETGPDLPQWVAADPHAVGQVLLNLLGNAVKFSQPGVVRLALDYDVEKGALRVRVQDSGPGLATDQAAKLFQRFSQVDGSSTRRHGGTGLGLAICKGLVEAMGGDIGVETSPGRGATFWFTIPAPVADAQRSDADGDDAFLDLDGVRLLVVDDNPINRELVRAILQPVGVDVSEAVDGLSGLELAGAQPFDLILLDIRMPGLDGHAVLARLREGDGPNCNVPVIAFSADLELGDAADFDDHIAKPLDPRSLILAVARWSSYEAAPQLAQADAG